MLGLCVKHLSVHFHVRKHVTELELESVRIVEGCYGLGTLKMEPEDIILCALVD